jgi:hypothetical protein
MVACVDLGSLEQQRADSLGSLVQLRACKQLSDPTLGVEQREDDVF